LKGIKYCLVASHFFREASDAQGGRDTSMTGLYSWVKAFKGTTFFVPRVDKDTAEKFDILHVNMTPRNMTVLRDLRKVIGYDSSTKIICNIDFAVDMWQENFKSPPITLLLHELRKADMLFHVEPNGAAILEHMLNLSNNGNPYKKVHVIPHPTDVKGISKKRKDNREPWCGVMWHRYDNNWLPPYLALEGLPNLEKILLGFIDYGKTGIAPTYEYDKVFRRLEFEEALEQMSKCLIGCDPFSLYNYGRAIVDFAVLGVPCITSDRIAAGYRLFPELVSGPFDVKHMYELMNKLYLDKEYYQSQKDLGIERAEYYSLENSRKRVLEALEMEDTGYPPYINQEFKKIWKDLTVEQWQEEYDQVMGFLILSGEYPPVTYKDGHLNIPTLPGRSQWATKQIYPNQLNLENKNFKILDVGCFQGITIFNLLLQGYWNITGVDPSKNAIEQAEKNKNVIQQVYDKVDVDLNELIKFKVGFGENLSEYFGNNEFDIIIGEELLEHVKDPVELIDEIITVLKPDGKAILTTPIENLVPSPYHIREFDEESIGNLFEPYSSTILSIKPFWGIVLYKDKRGKDIWKEREKMLFNLKEEND
jgi:2-polyprenyl-3-methyl-5-hydroxy-6-metoxy-1,4-benzoquinol methylase